MRANESSLGWLSDAHGIHEGFQGSQVASFNELDRSLILKVPIRRIQKDARIDPIACIKVHYGNPDPVDAPELRLQARSIWMFPHTRSFASNRSGNCSDGEIQFAGNTSRVKPA